jgi:hypothetical protein
MADHNPRGSGSSPTRWPIRIDRVIYTTITLTAVLIVYDGWESLSLGGVVAVIVGPVLAIFLSHVFAAELAQRVMLGRPMTRSERGRTLVQESKFMLIAIPPLALLLVLTALSVSFTKAIAVIVATGVLSLGFWGGLAGHRAGLRGWPFATSVLFGLGVGALMLALQAILQPGLEPFLP